MIIKQLREDAHDYLGGGDKQGLPCSFTKLNSAREQPLQKICSKLKLNKSYLRKRENKAAQKGMLQTLELAAE